jgi:hypothetical protein
VVEAKP